MKKLLIGLSLTSLLASCGSTPSDYSTPSQATNNSTTEKAFSKELTTPRNEINVELLAEYLNRPGMTPEQAQKAKNLRAEAEATKSSTSGSLSQQDIQAISEQDSAVNAAYDLISQGKVKQSSTLEKVDPMTAQSSPSRSTYLNATRNISTYSQSNFFYYKNQLHLSPYLNYEDDGCSSRIFLLDGWDSLFNAPCQQHDFGYRNGKRYTEIHNATFKAAVDEVFYQNMSQICNQETNVVLRTACFGGAKSYKTVVSAPAVRNTWLDSIDNTYGFYYQ